MRLDPKNPLASYNYGLVLLLMNELDEAITQFQIVLPSGLDDLDALYCLGRAFLAEGRPVEATACLQKAISLRPDDAHAHNVLGVALANIKEFSRAVGEFETARRLRPGNATFDKNLACVGRGRRGCGLTP